MKPVVEFRIGSSSLPAQHPPRFISYAQNFEDVVLWRALKSIRNGFYIDIGAHDPINNSVTCAFYRHGWRGISVEPAPSVFRRLSTARPRDISLQCLVDAEAGNRPFFIIDDESGFSTAVSDVAQVHRQAGMTSREITVEATTLTDICCRYVDGPIHFLKIDVEGAEAHVLKGADFERWRPWVVVLEATYPNTTQPSYEAWEPDLLSKSYRHVYSDGLNRFYLAAEHEEDLGPSFTRPPSPVLDWFISAGEANAYGKISELTLARDAIRAELEQARAEASLAVQAAQTAENQMRVGLEQARAEASLAVEAIASDLEQARVEASLAVQAAQTAENEMRRRLEQTRAGASLALQAAESRAGAAERALQALLSSTSWKLTVPLRVIRRFLSRWR